MSDPSLSITGAEWICRTPGGKTDFASLLSSRGIDPANSSAFLSPSLETDPAGLDGIAQAARAIESAIAANKKITIFGDFDCDGICASHILSTTLRELGAVSSVFIPLRKGEGYGLSVNAVERLLREQPECGLVATVDCGVASVEAVRLLAESGVSCVITDHHLPEGELPPALALADPKVACSNPAFAELCGAGVAFLLAYELAKGRNINLCRKLICQAALATIADVVPLTGYNRAIVKRGLELWQTCAPPGLQALRRNFSACGESPTERELSRLLAPVLNSAGRLSSAMEAYELLEARTPAQADAVCEKLALYNARRKEMEDRLCADAEAQLACQSGFAVAAGPLSFSLNKGWHPGVIGIVASRLSFHRNVPAAAIALDADGGGRGSLRTNTIADAVEILTACSETLSSFGGHSGAAGFDLKPGCYERFKILFRAACEKYSSKKRTVLFDGWIDDASALAALAQTVEPMGPFGEGNPEPLFGMRSAAIRRVRALGRDGSTLEVEFADRSLPPAVWFKHGRYAEKLRFCKELDVLLHLRTPPRRTLNSPRLNIEDIRLKD